MTDRKNIFHAERTAAPAGAVDVFDLDLRKGCAFLNGPANQLSLIPVSIGVRAPPHHVVTAMNARPVVIHDVKATDHVDQSSETL